MRARPANQILERLHTAAEEADAAIEELLARMAEDEDLARRVEQRQTRRPDA